MYALDFGFQPKGCAPTKNSTVLDDFLILFSQMTPTLSLFQSLLGHGRLYSQLTCYHRRTRILSNLYQGRIVSNRYTTRDVHRRIGQVDEVMEYVKNHNQK